MTKAWRCPGRGGDPVEPCAPGRPRRRNSSHRRRHGDPAAPALARTAGPGSTIRLAKPPVRANAESHRSGRARRADGRLPEQPTARLSAVERLESGRVRRRARKGVGGRRRRGPCLVTRHRRRRAAWVEFTAVRWARGSYAPPPRPAAPAAPPPGEKSTGPWSCGAFWCLLVEHGTAWRLHRLMGGAVAERLAVGSHSFGYGRCCSRRRVPPWQCGRRRRRRQPWRRFLCSTRSPSALVPVTDGRVRRRSLQRRRREPPRRSRYHHTHHRQPVGW